MIVLLVALGLAALAVVVSAAVLLFGLYLDLRGLDVENEDS